MSIRRSSPGSARAWPSWRGRHVGQLWVSDGTVDGTTSIADIGPFDVEYPQNFIDMAQVGGTLFMGASTDEANRLWRTDGTSPGTTIVRAMLADSLTDVAGVLCFRGVDADERWLVLCRERRHRCRHPAGRDVPLRPARAHGRRGQAVLQRP